MPICNYCKVEKDVKICTGCRMVSYCSISCQKQDRKDHRTFCNFVKNSASIANTETHMTDTMKSLLQDQLHRLFPELPNFSNEYKTRYPKESLHIKRLKSEKTTQKETLLIEKNDLVFEYEPNPNDMVKRWGQCDDRWIDFMQTAKPGDIYEYIPLAYLKTKDSAQNENIIQYQTIRNFVCTGSVYEFGNTCVSFGFVDFSQLMFGAYKNMELASSKIRYLCFDRCPIIVARAHVILRLLQMENVRTKTILQVWFSTCWDAQTFKEFKEACSLIIKEMNKESSDADIEYFKYIKHWLVSNISKKVAIQTWVSKKTSSEFIPLSNLKMKEDRIQFARYLLTGIIFVDESEISSGNISSFSMPSDGKKYERLNENLFFAIDIWKINLVLPESSSCNTSNNFMDFIRTFITEKLITFRDFVQKRQIEISIQQKVIFTDDFSFAAEIKKETPHIIEWSNVPDYMKTKEFILFCKACSKENTVHTLDVMNWQKSVFGASWIDYIADKSLLTDTYNKIKKETNIRYATHFNMETRHSSNHITKYIQPLFLDVPMDLFDKARAPKYVQKFIDHFYVDQDGSKIKNVPDLSRMTRFNPFSGSDASFHLYFTFNKDIPLKPMYIKSD